MYKPSPVVEAGQFSPHRKIQEQKFYYLVILDKSTIVLLYYIPSTHSTMWPPLFQNPKESEKIELTLLSIREVSKPQSTKHPLLPYRTETRIQSKILKTLSTQTSLYSLIFLAI